MPRFDVTLAGELNLDLILLGLPDGPPAESGTFSKMSSLSPNPSSPRNRQSLVVNLDEVRVYGLLSIELEQAH